MHTARRRLLYHARNIPLFSVYNVPHCANESFVPFSALVKSEFEMAGFVFTYALESASTVVILVLFIVVWKSIESRPIV
jgi:hypothetical protein